MFISVIQGGSSQSTDWSQPVRTNSSSLLPSCDTSLREDSSLGLGYEEDSRTDNFWVVHRLLSTSPCPISPTCEPKRGLMWLKQKYRMDSKLNLCASTLSAYMQPYGHTHTDMARGTNRCLSVPDSACKYLNFCNGHISHKVSSNVICCYLREVNVRTLFTWLGTWLLNNTYCIFPINKYIDRSHYKLLRHWPPIQYH